LKIRLIEPSELRTSTLRPEELQSVEDGQIELLSWLAALDDVRNYLIREAA